MQLSKAAPKKHLVLLSHHQPFSSYEEGGEKLLQKIQPLLGTGRVCSWFWGHEHRCACYAPRLGIQYPRLIGHGGIPVYAADTKLPADVRYEFQGAIDAGLARWALFGFAVLDFDGKDIHVRYIDENGVKHHDEVLRASS
jgi:hypothetical protein